MENQNQQENTQTPTTSYIANSFPQQLSEDPELLNIASSSQLYRHRQPRRYLQEGDEKVAYQKRLATVRSTEYNKRQKNRDNNLATQLETIESENKQLKKVESQLRYMKTRGHKIYDKWAKKTDIPSPSSPPQEYESD